MDAQKNFIGSVILGMGEVGSAHYEVLSKKYDVWGLDIKPELCKTNAQEKEPPVNQILHVCIRYSDKFIKEVNAAIEVYKPSCINICTTVPPGTTEQLSLSACHSTTRGLHPNLKLSLLVITKHIGGGMAPELKNYFEYAGIPCEIHRQARTTELLHILNNTHYGVNLAFADEAAKLCREYGVDYYAYMKYCETNNSGYSALDHRTKVRPILTPPGDKIGGHCVTMSANLIPKELRGTLFEKVATYNDKH